MTDSADTFGRTRPGRDRTADVDALVPNTPSSGTTYITLLTGLFSVGTGVALFAFGDAPTGAPVPLLSFVFIAAGVLVWSAAAVERQTGCMEASS